MAKEKDAVEAAKETVVEPSAEKKPTGPDIPDEAYTLDELAEASREVFGVPKECVVAALKPLKKEKMAVEEAKATVKDFMNKEVK